jgi:hypothetical protein
MRLLLLVVSAVVLTVATPSGAENPWPGVKINNQITRTGVNLALARASLWLERSDCRAILDDYRDQFGNRLSDNLNALGVDASTYLGWLRFRTGSTLRPCRQPATVMFTAPGSRVVFVCEFQLDKLLYRDQVLLTSLVIHEALHTLGLGENPPTSDEITARVRSRCRG